MSYYKMTGFPDLNLFWVGVKDKNDRLFGTLDNSIGLRSIMRFYKEPVSIDIVRDSDDEHYYVRRAFRGTGLHFIETGMIYKPKDINLLDEDYLIAKIARM